MKTFKSGKVTGTGAAIDIPLGFQPDYIKCYNPNDAGALYPTIEWFAGMPAANGLKSLKVVDSGATGNASQNKITANGLSLFAGDATNGPGFTIGADGDLNVVGEDIHWIAMREIS